MDSLNKPEPNLARTSPHRMSIQWHHNLQVPPTSQKSKSLPNIQIVCEPHSPHARLSPSTFPETEHEAKKSYAQHHHPYHQSQKPKILKKTWDKVKTIIHNPPLGSSVRRESLRKSETRAPLQRSNALISSAPSTPLDTPAFEFEEPYHDDKDEKQKIARNYALLQKRLSEELHQRMNECSKSNSGTGTAIDDTSRALLQGQRFPEHLSDEFRKKLQQWEMWKASTGKHHYTDEELKEIVPEDFGRKLVEWEVIRGGGQLENVEEPPSSVSGEDVRKPKRKFNFGSNAELPQSQHQKELAWLDKQLEKIEVEKKRLEREMKKYLEREARLEKMKEALKNSPTTEVYIKTPTAKCKVEKITEKFAKKLYEWEEKQGIGPESSALGLLNPKYYTGPEEEAGASGVDMEVENRQVLEKDDGGDGDDEEVIGPLDLINARLKAAEEEETEQDKSVRRAMEHMAEALALADEEVVGIVREGEGRISSTASSCCCSEYDQTDSKISGASNTDSEAFYSRPDPNKLCTNSRRRSSDAISTPLSNDARSPSLSAFTSDDECEVNNAPLLKRVSEEDDNSAGGGVQSVSRHSTMKNTGIVSQSSSEQVKDAESQTDVILRAKQIVVEDDDSCGNDERAWDSTNGIFVQTKRTIFAPIVGDVDSEKVVLIREDIGSGDGPVLAEGGAAASIPKVVPVESENEEEEDRPRIVGAIPKRPTQLNIRSGENPIQPRPYKPQPKTQLNRSFPKMGKIPVWCSPLVARKQMFSGNNDPEQQQGASTISVTTPDDSDFSIDRFLQDSKLLDAAMNSCVGNNGVEGQQPVQDNNKPETKRPTLTSRLPKTNAFLPRKYTIGGGYPPRSGCVLTRSNSFGYPKGGGSSGCISTNQQDLLQPPSLAGAGSNATLESFSSVHTRDEESQIHSSISSMHSVTKSRSTGSIKSKFGRAFARVGLGFGKETKSHKSALKTQSLGEESENVNNEEGAVGGSTGNPTGDKVALGNSRRDSGSGTGGTGSGATGESSPSGFTGMNPLRRFGSWVSRVGGNSFDGSKGGGGGAGGGND